jgi:Fic family protein
LNKKDFKAPEAGRVIRAPQGYWAFLPAPLPPKLQYDADLVRQLSRADAALSELSGLGRQLPNPHLLIAPWVRREAVLSSRIEGTRASLSDLLKDELGGPRKSAEVEADVREVRNYVDALEYGIERLDKLPLSLRLVRELHERLMRGVRGDRATPGEFRRSQNWIGESGSTPTTASYVPPPINEMEACLDAWEKFLHQRDTMPDLVQCALMHEQFEAIHPFLDGNGRVGRLLITLFLIERGRLSQPLLYLSAYIEQHRQDYYDLLQRVRTHGDWISWLRYFVHGVEVTAADAARRTTRLLDLRNRYHERLKKHELVGTLLLIDELFVNPYVTVARAEKVMRVSNPTARAAVNHLQSMKILKEITGRGWGRIYVADAIRKVIEEK